MFWDDVGGLPDAPGAAVAKRYESVPVGAPPGLDLTYGLAQFGEVEDYPFTSGGLFGACCLAIGLCIETTAEECASIDKANYHGDGTTCDEVACTAIPAVSTWGLIVTTLLLLTGATVILGRRRRSAPA